MQRLQPNRLNDDAIGDKSFFHFQGFFLGRWLDGVLVFLGLFSFCATVVLTLRLIGFSTDFVRWSVAVGVLVLVGFILLLTRGRFEGVLLSSFLLLKKIEAWKILIFGLAVRILWIVAFPAKPGSDGAVYVSLANGLVEKGVYEIAGTFAYWPAGYPLILAGWQYILPGEDIHYVFLNLLLFVAMFIAVVLLVTEFAGGVAGRWAGFAIALWPNYITSTATPEKELVVAALLPWCAYILVCIASRKTNSGWLLLGCGCLLGVCTLVQPSLQLLVPVVMVSLLLTSLRSAAERAWFAALVLIGASMIILPWAYRNYTVFDQFVLVSTNGGSNLYRANNSLATGGYTERGEVDLSNLDELAQDREGKRLAKEWVVGNFPSFLKLSVEKQTRFLGDDATGVYTTLKVGGASSNNLVYVLLKSMANLWWMLAWLTLVFLIVFSKVEEGAKLFRIPIWFFLYLLSLHAVFESAGKYHLPVLWVLPCMLAVYLASNGSLAMQRK